MKIQLIESEDAPEKSAIAKGIREFNQSKAGPSNSKPLILAMKNDHGEVIAGLSGTTSRGWLSIELLWVSEALRGKDIGSHLLLDAERVAKERGCQAAYLDTFGFQALGFYEKHGYRPFGELNDFPKGHTRYFLHKNLT